MHSLARQLLAAAAAGAIALAASPSIAADVKAGVDAWQAGNYAAAIAEWRPLADRGDDDAQFNMGQAYRLGKGVPMDLRIAQSWFQKAAQQGHSQAQANLGMILFQNGNRAGAMPWIRKAADAGDARSQYILGTALFNGDLVGKDWPRAYALMTRAAAQGLPPAAANLAEMEKIIPLAERRQGIAMARQLEQGTRIAAAAPAVVVRPAPRMTQNTGPAAVARPAARPPAPAAIGRGWRVQLGAFGSAANARRAWDGLRGRAAGLGGLQPAFVPAGTVTRLQAGPVASKAAADRVCASVRAAGSACFPVAP